MNLKKWTLLVAMMGVLLATAFANGGNEVNKNRANFIKERKAYFLENIKPKIDAQRNKLEVSISAEDKKEISKLREEVIREKLLQNEFIFEMRSLQIKGEEIDEGLYDEIRAQRIVIENLYDKAKIIANNYRPEIDDLLAELSEEGKEWRGQMRGQKGEFEGHQRINGRKPMGSGSFGDMGIGMRHNSHGNPGRHFGPGSAGGFGIATFLLWDVNRG